MSEELIPRDFFVQPGYVCLPAEPTRLSAVVTSGVAVTLFDARRRCGGMSHYALPYRQGGVSTAIFAAPSIVSLVNMFTDSGSAVKDLEAQLYGAACNRESERHEEQVNDNNALAGVEVLTKLRVRISSQDTGGTRGRKIVFYTATGEIVIAKVDQVRQTDWYPDCIS